MIVCHLGGWLIEDNQIVAYCGGDICDVCDQPHDRSYQTCISFS